MGGFGSKLAEYRKRKGLSQTIFAERVGMSVSHLSLIEKGTQSHPRLQTMFRMMEVLELTREQGIDLLREAGFPTEFFNDSSVLIELDKKKELIESIEVIQSELDLLKRRLVDEST